MSLEGLKSEITVGFFADAVTSHLSTSLSALSSAATPSGPLNVGLVVTSEQLSSPRRAAMIARDLRSSDDLMIINPNQSFLASATGSS